MSQYDSMCIIMNIVAYERLSIFAVNLDVELYICIVGVLMRVYWLWYIN